MLEINSQAKPIVKPIAEVSKEEVSSILPAPPTTIDLELDFESMTWAFNYVWETTPEGATRYDKYVGGSEWLSDLNDKSYMSFAQLCWLSENA